MSPTTVMEPESDRRASMRSCIGERSCTSSTTMWPKERISSSDPAAALAAGSGEAARPWGQNPTSDAVPSSVRLARARAGRPRRGPSSVRASSMSAASPTVHGTVSSEALRGRYRRCTSAALRIPLPAAASSGAGAEEVVQELVGRQAGPHPVERLADLGHPAQPLGQVLLLLGGRRVVRAVDAAPAEPGPVLVRQHAQDLRLDEAPTGVVRARAATGHADDVLGRPGPQAQHAGAEGDLDVAAERALAGAHGPGQHLDHAHVALQLGDGGVVDAAHAHLGHQARDRRQAHPGLAERREDLLDVAQEQRVRPHDEHALALEREAVGVEQVGGTVQRHRRLAGAGAALDDEDPGQRRADDLVLLALDGADDVAHVARPGLAERGQEGAGAAQDQPVGEEALRRRP